MRRSGDCLFVNPSESYASPLMLELIQVSKPDSVIASRQEFFTRRVRLYIPTPPDPPHGITRPIDHQAFPHRS